ncbi:5-oxoprolinase subunit C family protein [Flavicella sediminum]|uniref:5-oxoprolinase subunit C family protein n=1 Tax=Flavicella sediminum TaxID=2585141 RepID=UPI00111D6136|nr:biotin-dependent carboxyltransferase family protein [Flavicella sediminum]
MIEILKPGFSTTIQDLGRFGYQDYGMPISGAMDTDAAKLANWLVGNHSNEAVLELTLIGPVMKFHSTTFIGITGANLNPQINGTAIAMYKSVKVEKGAVLSFGKLSSGVRTYISFSGGLQLEKELGSFSTYSYAALGGFQGRALKKGDRLLLNTKNITEVKKVPKEFQLAYTSSLTVRVLPSIEFDLFSEESQKTFFEKEYVIGAQSNRMGYRLEGDALCLKEKAELLSSGIITGTVQVPENGQPIVLLTDAQTTGGYPRIANVIAIDLPFLGQQKPGDKIRFRQVSLEEAQALNHNKNMRLKKLLKT